MAENVKIVPNVTVIYQDGSGKTSAPGCLEIVAMLITLSVIAVAFGWLR